MGRRGVRQQLRPKKKKKKKTVEGRTEQENIAGISIDMQTDCQSKTELAVVEIME